MLYFKIILALLLSAIPFLFKHFILPKRESSPACRNAITAAASAMPYLKRWRRKYFNISIRIYNAMKHSIEARKFFTLLMLLVLLTITMVDFNASATIATALNIKPVLHVDNEGKLVGLGKTHGRKKAIANIADRYGKLAKHPETGPVFISHGDCIDDVNMLADLLHDKYGVDVDIVSYVGPVIGAHSGPGTLALFFEGKER